MSRLRLHSPAAVAALAMAVTFAFASPAQAKVVVNGFGTAGTLGGQFGTPGGVAVNDSGAGGVPSGTTYVADTSQNRIQRFTSAGAFERAWGFDVDGTTAGTGFEICTAVSGDTCKAGATTPTTANGGQLSSPQGIAVSQASGHVYVTENGNRRVSEFDAGGNFVRAWGWDVSTAAGTGFEICESAAACKQAAAAGAGAGQFGGAIGYPTLDSAGNVWVPDQTNNRIQEFDFAGNFLKMVGGDVITDGAEGTGTLSTAVATVSAVGVTKRFFEVGQAITAAGGQVPAGTTILSCAPAPVNGVCQNPTSLTLSQKPTAAGTGVVLTAPEGGGNHPVNEVQTVTAPSGTAFNLTFNGQGTQVAGSADFSSNSLTATNVSVTTGTFALLAPGQEISSNPDVPAGTKITAVDPISHTLALSSKPIFSGVNQTFQVTAITNNASAADVQGRLEALSTIGTGNVGVGGPDGGPWSVEFKGVRFAGADVPAMTPAGRVTSANPGALEVCSVAAECRTGAPGTAAGQFSGTSPGDLAFDAGGNLYALDAGGKRVEQFNPALSAEIDFGASALAAFTASAPERLVATQGGTRLDLAVNNTSAAERQIVELDASGALKETSLVGSGLNGAIGGLAASGASGNLYVTTAAASSPRRVLVLSSTPLAAPAPVLSPPTAITATSATFSGTVDPKGGLVSCSFEYSLDQVAWTPVAVPGCDTLSPGGGPQAISASVSGLSPNGQYSVRLAVSRSLVPNTTVTTALKEFATEGTPPIVSNFGLIEVTGTSVRVVATIDPRHSSTAYVIQYGTDPVATSATAPVSIGGGASPLIVSQVVGGLALDTTYYFRVVATNLTGPTATGTKAVRTASEAAGPTARAYEQVSPVDKNYGNVDAGNSPQATAAWDGEAAGWCTGSTMAGSPYSGVCGSLASRRTATGWQATALVPPYCGADFTSRTAVASGSASLSPNLDYAAIKHPEASTCTGQPLDPAAPLPGANLYREDLTAAPAGRFQLLAPAPSFAPSFTAETGHYEGAGADFSRIVFTSTGQQAAGAPAGNFNKVYEWHEGVVSLVSVKQDGTPFTEAAKLPVYAAEQTADGINAVSADGSRIYFEAPQITGTLVPAAAKLYLREGGSATFEASQSECTSSCGAAAGKAFMFASPSGSSALLKSAEKLTDEPTPTGSNLYLFRQSADPATDPHNLTLVSRDSEPADGTNAEFQGILGMSDDGETVYFAASGQLVEGKPTAAGPKVYRWRWNGGSPTLAYLATLSSVKSLAFVDSINWSVDAVGLISAAAMGRPGDQLVTPDGRYLLLQTLAPLDPVADTDIDADVYRWGEEGGWTCLSCQAPGAASAGKANMMAAIPFPESGDSLYRLQSDRLRIVMSEDGKRVFFGSHDELVPGDVNGAVEDVYEWHGGAVNLISSGHSSESSKLIGASISARDVFFITADRLVGWDQDFQRDVYDARIGGGFPEPPAAGAACEGDACRGASSSTPGTAGSPGTAQFQGSGNVTAPASRVCPRGTRRQTVHGKKVCRKTHRRKRHHKRHARRANAKGRVGK
jgi:hypothetical protein